MKKRVFLLAVSCKNGGLCPGGIDLDNPKEWIRIVRDDGQAGAVQGHEIDFAQPLDVIEFDGRPMPQGKQKENWVIDNHSCRKIGTESMKRVMQAFREYGYHGFWNNGYSYLREDELENVTQPSESILLVSDVRLYKNDYGKAKIDFTWSGLRYPMRGVSLTTKISTIYWMMKKSVISMPSLSYLFPRMPTGHILKQVKEEHISLSAKCLEVTNNSELSH